MSRQRKTPAQRAEEALSVETRKVERLEAACTKHEDALNDLAGQLEDAKRRRDYLAKHPDLQQNTTNPPEETHPA